VNITPNSGEAIVTLDRVFKTYPDGTRALRDISLRICRGETVALMGPSGSGKSTFLHLVGGLERATSGRLTVAGEELGAADQDRLACLRQRGVGIVFQEPQLLSSCTVLENVLLPRLATQRATTAADLARALELLDAVGLGKHAQGWPARLSGGERQRVALVRALINSPPVLLADEPTGSLDRATSEALVELLLRFNREQGLTLIVATHAPEVGARMGRLLHLEDGSLAGASREP
jgi:ABC-type lipoprotein export system ATPase subunit